MCPLRPKTVNANLDVGNEITHGLSDTLLSILAQRAGELVNSIFGARSNTPDQLVPNGLAAKSNLKENGHTKIPEHSLDNRNGHVASHAE